MMRRASVIECEATTNTMVETQTLDDQTTTRRRRVDKMTCRFR